MARSRGSSTDGDGNVEMVRVLHGQKTQHYAGCGIKLSRLPHLTAAYEQTRWTTLSIRDACIVGVTTGLPTTAHHKLGGAVALARAPASG